MASITDTPTFTCPTCELPVHGQPTFHLGLAFCCAGCAADGPCRCSYDDLVALPHWPDDALEPVPTDRGPEPVLAAR